MFANIILFGFAVKKIIQLRNFGSQTPSRKAHANLLKATMKLFMSLGLTWITGLVVLTNAGTAVQWIFTIFVSSQGSFIFLLQKAVFQQETAKHKKYAFSAGGSSGILSSILRQVKTKLGLHSRWGRGKTSHRKTCSKSHPEKLCIPHSLAHSSSIW